MMNKTILDNILSFNGLPDKEEKALLFEVLTEAHKEKEIFKELQARYDKLYEERLKTIEEYRVKKDTIDRALSLLDGGTELSQKEVIDLLTILNYARPKRVKEEFENWRLKLPD